VVQALVELVVVKTLMVLTHLLQIEEAAEVALVLIAEQIQLVEADLPVS
jgi:hypothetical protein